MALKVNFKGWKTAPADTNLCASCKWATIVKGHLESQEIIYCNMVEKQIGWRVTECDSYANKHLPSLNDMKEIAFVLEMKKGKIGFISPTEMKKRHPGWEWDE